LKHIQRARIVLHSADRLHVAEVARRAGVNRALFDLTMNTAVNITREEAPALRDAFRERYATLLNDEEFSDLISRAVDHTKRTKRRFAKWEELVGQALI
jgi:hypothetical protein